MKNNLANFDKSFRPEGELLKSRIYFLPNVEEGMADVLSQAAEMTRTNDLGKYLGARLVPQRCNKEMFDEFLAKL